MQSSYRAVLRCLLEGIQWLDPSVKVKVAGTSGISQARTRLDGNPCVKLHDEVVRRSPPRRRGALGTGAGGWSASTAARSMSPTIRPTMKPSAGSSGDIERAAVDADQPPAPVPSAPRRLGGDRPNHLVVQLTQGFPSKPRTGLRDAGLPRHLDLHGRVKPLACPPTSTEAPPIGRLHVQRQSNYVIDHHVSRKIALPDTRFAGRS